MNILIFIAIFISVWVISHLYKDWNKAKKQNELQYDITYLNLKTIISKWDVNERSYCLILKCILKLRSLKYHNEEKTSVLEMEFYRKYKPISDKILAGDTNTLKEIEETYIDELNKI